MALVEVARRVAGGIRGYLARIGLSDEQIASPRRAVPASHDRGEATTRAC